MKKSLLILALAGTMAVAQSAFALTVYDPTNHTENLATKLQMIEQVKNSAQQLQNDIKNLQKLDPSELQLSLNYIQETIQDLNRLREQTDAIGTEYDQLMSEWDEKLLKYGKLFEEGLMDLRVNISLEEALDFGWKILAECFEPNETGLKTSLLQAHWPKRDALQ